MRGLVQRVAWAGVRVDGAVVGEIGAGLCVLVGVTHDDDEHRARRLADKLVTLRVFEDEEGRMNRSVVEAGGGVLVIPQFTLYGDTSRGRRPSWVAAAAPEHAEPLVTVVADRVAELGPAVATGRFRAHMAVELCNDGPVTLLLET